MKWVYSAMTYPARFPLRAGVVAVTLCLVSCFQTGRINVVEQLPLTQHPGAFKGSELFQGPVRSVIEHRCIHCHDKTAANGGLNLQDRELVFDGDSSGPFLVPGKPDESRIWKVLLLPEKHHKMMPADGWGLTLYEIQSFRAWIEAGAYWPDGRNGELERKPFAIEETKPLRH